MMKNKTGFKVQTVAMLSALTVAILLITSLFPLVYAAVPWTKDPGDLSLTESGIYDELFVIDSWVIKNASDDYEMWYTHSRSDMTVSELGTSIINILSDEIITALVNLDLGTLLDEMALINATSLWNFMTSHTTVIGYATSSDGMNWTVQNDQVLAGTADTWENYGAPCVIKNDVDDYQMWFTYTDATLDQSDLATYLDNLDDPTTATVRDALISLINCTSSAIGYATSSDGMDWGTPQLNVFDSSGSGVWDIVATPCVIKNSDTDYDMWYTYAETSLTTGDIDDILDNIGTFGADDLWDILDNDIQSTIGYATSTDGETDWTISNPSVISGTGGLWDSVFAPCVIKNGGVYEIWYTSFTSDLDSTEFGNLFSDLKTLETDILDLWASFTSSDLDTFLTDFDAFFGVSGPFDAIRPYLDDTATRISYATSLDGTSWDIQNPDALVGDSGSPWSSVASPCVVWEGGLYQMWYTEGFDPLTAQNLVYLLDGTDLPIGYATATEGIDLVTGWNFIGLPEAPVSTAIEDVLAGIIDDVEIVWYYEGATASWFYFVPDGPQTLTEMTEGKGYWIETTNLGKLIVFGTEPPMPYDITLVAGWNLISLPETPVSTAIEDVLAGIIDDVEIVWYYEGATASWFYFVPDGPQTLTEMTEGKAYWIEMSALNTLTIYIN